MPSNIVNPKVAFVDPKTGIISREWFRFLLDLFELTGGGQNSVTLTDLLQAPPPVPYVPPADTAVAGRFYAYKGSSAALPSAADTVVVFNTEVYDDTGEYDNTTGLFTAAEDSVWSFTGGIGYTGLADQTRTRTMFKVGTTTYFIGGDNASGASSRIQVSNSITLSLSAGDTVAVTAYVPSAGPQAEGGGPCYLYGIRIR